MTFNDIIRSRKSTFPVEFSSAVIDKQELEELLSATVYTPSHKKTNPWRYQVFSGKKKANLAQELAKLYKETTPPDKFLLKKYDSIEQKIAQTPVLISIVMKVSGKVPEWEEVAAVSMSVQNLWLKATEMGLSGYWSSPRLIEHTGPFLNLEKNEKCLGFFYLGKSDHLIEKRQIDWKPFVEFV